MKRQVGAFLLVGATLLWADVSVSQSLSTYGTPGLVELPTAEVLKPGELAFTTSHFSSIHRNTAVFQFLPRVYATFRYTISRGNDSSTANDDNLDRSIDLHYQIADESLRLPAFAVGLRDIGGTGIFASEYIVATKTFGEKIKLTGGLGWGRLGERNSISNPLGALSDRFDTRPDSSGSVGELDANTWFRGPAAFFAGVNYQATKKLNVQLEYSSDTYSRERSVFGFPELGAINVGLNYQYSPAASFKAFVIGGEEIGAQFSYILNPAKRRVPGDLGKAPLPIVPRDHAVVVSWGLDSDASRAKTGSALKNILAEEGIELQGFSTRGSQATVQVENDRWDVEAQAVGRTARAMTNVLPAHVDRFVITMQNDGVPNSTVTLSRADLEDLETDYDGAWKSLARARITDAADSDRSSEFVGAYPKFSYGFGPYRAVSLFDPDDPVRFDIGAELELKYAPRPGLSFSGVFRQPVYGTIEDATRVSDSVIQRVRSDAVKYAQESNFEINRLTADYVWRPGDDLFARVSVGHLEAMYGGLSGELLWYPIDSRLAVGVEANYVRQRDFDMLLGFQDYSVVTGHASAYYDLGNGFQSQVDVGRYLAGDWGATFALDREFTNGFKVGGYFTLTDVSFDEFGEGSFDKGIRVSVPLSFFTGKPSRETISQTIQPVLRDGGARLNVSNRLFSTARDYRGDELSSGWARFYQ